MEKQKNQIDYIMIEKRWSSSIQNVTTKRDADCDTDHKRLVATLKIRLKCKKKTDLPIRYNVQDISHDFKVELRNRFKVLLELIAEKCPDIIANETRNIIMETAGKHLRKRTNKKQKWMSEQTLNKIKERKECKKNCGTQNDAYKIFAKEVKQLCRNDKKSFLIAKCTKIEDHMKENKRREMYEETNNLTKSFQPRLGVIKDKYGKTLTHLFSLYTKGIMREVSLDHRKDDYEESTIQGVHLKDLRYANDTALLSTTPTGLEKLIKSVKEHSDEKGLFLYTKKTKILEIDKLIKEARIAIDGEEIERVSNFEHLGARIEANGKSTAKIRRRLAMARTRFTKMISIWKGQCKKTKLRFLETVVFPTALYGCEAWTINNTDAKRITSFEMKCYRKILRMSWMKKVTDKEVLSRLDMKTTMLLQKAKTLKLKCFGHIKSHETLERHILEARIDGRRGGEEDQPEDGSKI